MAIAVVFESFVRAGSQRHLVEILKGIRLYKPDLACKLFLIASIDQAWQSFLPEVEQAGVPVSCLPYRFDRVDSQSIRARVHNWWSRWHRERVLNHEFYDKLSAYDAVICAQPFVADLLLPNLYAGQRLCFHFSEHPSQRPNHDHYRLLTKRRINVIYQHSSQLIQLAHYRNPNPSITWPLRLCPDHLQEPLATTPDTSGVLRIAHYSRVSPMRKIDQVIDAFALLHQRTPAKLRIAGFIEDKVYNQNLLSQIQRLGLSDNVQFVDPVPSPAEDPARSDVDLVWMISLSGHIGYAGIEAMAAGWPTLLLEVDSRAHACPVDPELSSLICATPDQLVERSLALQADSSTFRQQQAKLLRDRFITTKEAIDELTAFYLHKS